MTAGPLQPGSCCPAVFANRPAPEQVPRIEGVRRVFHRCWCDEQQPEALATITRGKIISEMTAWDRNTMGGHAR